ncbi:MAG: peptidylprolyl isomerase [Pseudomonadota bacterium]
MNAYVTEVTKSAHLWNVTNPKLKFSALKQAVSTTLICVAGFIALPACAQFKIDAGPIRQNVPAQAPLSMPVPVQAVPATALSTEPAKPRSVDAIAAVVNNEVITRNDLAQRAKIVERRIAAQNVAMPPREQLEKQLLERMISDRAQLQLANDLGIRIDDTLLDRAVAKIAEQNKLSLAQFRTEIERDGTPFALFREDIRQEITLQRLREREVDAKIQITEAEVDAYLSSPTGAKAVQEINLAQIMVRIPENASAEQIAERRARAEDVMRQLRTGADFGKTAVSFSDAGDALEGGDLGWRNADRLPQMFVEATAELKQGELSKVVKSANGFHILKVVGRRDVAAGEAAGAAAATVQQTRARHILVKVNQVVSVADARRKLSEVKERLDNKAAKFEDLAKLYSNDLSASKGGDLGWVYPGDTVPEFERAMDALKPGEVSAPIESPFGVHLIQVLERKSDDVSKERQRLVARQAVRERKLDEATQDWARQVRDRAYVEVRADDRS